MSQLQKRCFVASIGLHGLLLFIVLFGAAFFLPKSPPVKSEILTMIPDILIDDAISGGGGNPNIPKPDEPQIQKGETIIPDKAKPLVPEPPKPKEKVPDPVKEIPKEAPKEAPKETAKPKDERKVTLSDLKPKKQEPVKPNKDKAAASKATESALAKELAQAREKLQAGFSKGTVIEPSGPGGAAYASYASFVRAIYDDNWIITENMSDKGSVTLVEVVIDRDGDVVSRKIVRYSGNGPLDRSVQAVLDRVQHIRPFPEGAKDKTRKFTIEFNLKDKLGSG